MNQTWNAIVANMKRSRERTTELEPYLVEHPRDAGMRPTVAPPRGQRATYALALGTGETLFVYDFGSKYFAHLAPPRASALAPVEQSLRESPGASLLGASALGALLGLALGGTKESALLGAAAGGAFGLAAVTVSNAESSPATSDASRELLNAVLEAAKVLAESRTATVQQLSGPRVHATPLTTPPRPRALPRSTTRVTVTDAPHRSRTRS